MAFTINKDTGVGAYVDDAELNKSGWQVDPSTGKKTNMNTAGGYTGTYVATPEEEANYQSQSNSGSNTSFYNSNNTTDYTPSANSSSNSSQSQSSSTGQSQTQAQADSIRQAQAMASLKSTYDAQLASTIGTYNTERAKIPGQTETANNTASSTGMVNAQHIRNALSQMGLLQSGESATQQLANDSNVANNINANNLAGQQLDASYADKITAAIAQNAVDYNTAAYQYGRDAVSDSQWAVTSAQAQQQINNQSSQFAQTLGLSQQQLAATIAQNGAQNALAAAGLAQNASQFAAQLGLSTSEYYAGLAQWALNYNASVDQTEFNNGIAIGNITGNYAGNVSTGTDRVVINADGTISTVPVDAVDPVTETTTDVMDESGNIKVDLTGKTTDKSGFGWNNYEVVGPDHVAPSKNANGATLTGYRLVSTTGSKKYYIPIYSDQMSSGTLPRGYRKTGDIDGIPTYKEL